MAARSRRLLDEQSSDQWRAGWTTTAMWRHWQVRRRSAASCKCVVSGVAAMTLTGDTGIVDLRGKKKKNVHGQAWSQNCAIFRHKFAVEWAAQTFEVALNPSRGSCLYPVGDFYQLCPTPTSQPLNLCYAILYIIVVCIIIVIVIIIRIPACICKSKQTHTPKQLNKARVLHVDLSTH